MADLYYIEEGYYDAGYFVYTADAAAALSSSSQLQCTISHIEGADLEAFTSAALTAQANRLRQLIGPSEFTWQEQDASWDDWWLSLWEPNNTSEILRVYSGLEARPVANNELVADFPSISSFSATIGYLVQFSSNLTATFTESAQDNYLFDPGAQLSTSASMQVDAHKTTDSIGNLASEFTQVSPLGRTRNFDSALVSTSTLDCAIAKYTGYDSQLSSEFTNSIDYTRPRFNSAAFSNTFTSNIDAGKITDTAALLAVESQLSAALDRDRSTAVDLTVQADLTALGGRLEDIALTASNFASLSCEATTGFVFSIALAAEFSQSTSAIRDQQTSADIVSTFTQSASAIRDQQTSADILSAFSLTAPLQRVRHGNAAISAQAELLAATGYLQRFAADLAATANMEIVNTRTRDHAAQMLALSLTTIAAAKTTDSALNLQAHASCTAALAKLTGLVATELATQATLSVINTRARYQASWINSQFTIAASGTSTGDIVLNLASTGTLAVSPQYLRQGAAALISQSACSATITRIRGASANLAVEGFQLTAGRVIHFDPYLTLLVEQETRQLTVNRESRLLLITQETRVLAVE